MIGHYVNQLTSRAEDVLLTARLGWAPGYINEQSRCTCIRGALIVSRTPEPNLYRWELHGREEEFSLGVATRWDELCKRFGDVRIANATRNRILSNRARRELGSVRESPGGVSAAT